MGMKTTKHMNPEEIRETITQENTNEVQAALQCIDPNTGVLYMFPCEVKGDVWNKWSIRWLVYYYMGCGLEWTNKFKVSDVAKEQESKV